VAFVRSERIGIDTNIPLLYYGSMRATTIKLEGSILEELEEFKRPDQNLTSLVREMLKAQIHRRKMAQAAEEYTAFLNASAGEALELEVWATAPLEKEPAVRRKKRA
jgi:hypothetical protein